MRSMTVRNVPEETHRRIRIYAAERGISIEAAVRKLLDNATKPQEKLGTSLAEFAREHGAAELNIQRDKAPARAVTFE